ncbi:hypothetical protein DKX38_004541 [Salix brachista]|uniref:Tubby C-terminal domain-containing protein n=1 Tax=Salix brachista TaxID=2182728 RepID=A0A5N5NBX4_9ROSI|nr:hypothetical protein DKX38_004541 [Salix brachista]
MAKVFPQSQRPVLDPYVSTEKETFTIWMKSLVCQTNGCTVFDSNGDIVYRIDNYDKKCSNKVYLMDLRGRVIVTIRRKVLQIQVKKELIYVLIITGLMQFPDRFNEWDSLFFFGSVSMQRLQILGCWYGYRLDSGANEEKPWFQVKQYGRLFCMGSFACQVTVGFDKYWVVKLGSKQAFRIVNIDSEVIAEVKQKQLSSGISMGEDVLTLAVEPHVDHSLIMAIVTVYGLINYKL